MKPRPIEEAKTPDLRLSLQAMKRARQRAEEIARATNTALVQMVDGKMVFVRPGAPRLSRADSKLPGE